jgi:hypothetical protein
MARGPEFRFGGVPLAFVYAGKYEIKGQSVTSLWFTSGNALVATFVVSRVDRNAEPPTRRAASDSGLPLQLRAIFLDAATGNITANRAWPTESRWSRITAVNDGRFLVQCGNELTLYSSDFLPIQHARLPDRKEVDAWLALPPRAEGKTIVMAASNRTSGSFLWLDIDTLKVVRSWEGNLNAHISVTDDRIALSTNCRSPDGVQKSGVSAGCRPSGVKIRDLSTNWETATQASDLGLELLRDPGWKTIAPAGDLGLRFINDETLLLSGNSFSGQPLRLIRADGSPIFSEPLPPASSSFRWNAIEVSVGGTRFVVPGYRTQGRVPSLDITRHSRLEKILLYDTSTNSEARIYEVRGPKIEDERQLVLSPDGSSLAILNGETIELFKFAPTENSTDTR